MEELWNLLHSVGMAGTIREITCKIPKFEDWHAPARQFIEEARRMALHSGSRTGKRARTGSGNAT